MKRLKGAYPAATPGKWISRINYGATQKHLGTFDTEQEAHEAFMKADANRTRKPHAINKGRSTPVVYDGKRYDSVREFCKAFKLPESTVFSYMKHDKPFRGHYIDEAL